MKYDGYFTKKELEAKGWTIKMFTDYLPKPHKTVPNPVNPSWAPMGLYEKSVVLEIESSQKFQDYKEWTVPFRSRMREVAAKRNIGKKTPK